MRIKSDFVTNSSTTNFLIIDRRPDKEEDMIINVTKAFRLNNHEVAWTDDMRGFPDLRKYVYDDESFTFMSDDLRYEIEAGNKVYFVQVMEGAEGLFDLLASMKDVHCSRIEDY